MTLAVQAANPPPTQLFYVPFPEDQQLQAFDAINTVANDPITVFVTFSAATDGTVIYYDHWEDGYEANITNPTQSTTLIFGDGNPANGYPPGNAADQIPAGTVFSLRNFVNTATLQSVLDYDARDKVASFKPISLTKTSFPDGTDTLLAGCVEVFERGLWGTEYRSPVGVDMPTSTATATLTNDENLFSYVALSISAGPGGASVQIDKDNNGAFEETVVLTEGQSIFRDAVNTGGRVLADKPVQVVLFTGTVGSNYASRDTNLLPVNRWSSDYFSPVSTPATNGTVTFIYNPGAAAITVNYQYRNSLTTYATASVSVPAGGNARVTHAPASGTTHYGAYRFYTTGANPPPFYAISAVDADETTSGNNQNWDGGFTLVGKPSLTTQVLLSLGIGRDPYSSTSPGQNGNPMWICTVGNGHTPATIYVDYNGDNAGSLTDPNGNKYDVSYSLRELEQKQLYDPDGDQSGMLAYTLDSSVKIAAAWAQDPTVASIAQPGLDVASLVPPLREGEAGKRSNLLVDADGDSHVSAGDTLEYDIRGVNSARASIPGPFAVTDVLPADVTYVSGSTRYRFSVGGAWQAWTNIPDNSSGTPFPLDGAGFSVPGNLGTGQQLQVVFKAAVKSYGLLSGATITNTGTVEISPYGLVLPVEWTDIIYGSIGDRVWNDLNGDGVQDGGEAGIAGIDVFADLNNNGVWDSGEPKDTTDSNGDYLIAGLPAGTYTVRVDPADVAVVNVGYGPSYDLDGVATSYVATVVLAGAQDRVDADFGFRVGASVGDRVWVDRDADGVQENGEPGINGVRVYLDLDNDNAYDIGEPNTITSGDGNYYIGNLNPGTYAVRVDTSTLPSGAVQTFDLNGVLDHEASVTLIAAEHRGDLDFGYRGTLSIGDLVWEDANANGSLTTTSTTYNINNGRIDVNRNGNYNEDGFIGSMRIVNGYADIDNDNDNNTPDSGDDGTFLGVAIINGGFDILVNGTINNQDDGQVTYNTSESGIPNVRVYVDIDGDGVFDATEPSAITASDGTYSIGNLFGGTYTVRVVVSTLPASYAQTYDLTNPTNDHAATVVLSGTSRTDADFGYRNDASIGDFVWNDRDNDGVQDVGEPGIEGVLVYIDADGDNTFDQGAETYDITDVNGFYLIENLAAGTYSVRVEFSTLPQGSTQTYDLDATLDHETSRTLATSENANNVDFGYRASASVGDFVWNDVDADGVQDAGESGINGLLVYLDINGNGFFDSATEPSATTNSSGAYTISNLLPGVFTARVDVSTLPATYVQTYDLEGALDHGATFSLSASQARTDVDFGYTQRVTIGDLVWNDADADGQQDGGETGISGVTVTAYNVSNDTIAAITTTDSNGAYAFNLMPGSYYLVFDTPAGFASTLVNQGADSSDSDAAVATGRTPNVTLTGGQSNLTLDGGYYQPCTIGDFVYNDANANGQQDGGETGLAGVIVTLYRLGFGPDGIPGNADDATAVAPQTTVSGGAYSFSGVRPGTYQVNFGALSGYSRTLADQGADATDSDANVGTGLTGNYVLAAGATNNTIDAGYYLPGTVFGHLYIDTNGNSTQDTGEPDLANVNVIVTDSLGTPQTVSTDANGNWTATVPPGSTSANADETDPQYPIGYTQTEGSDPTVVTAVSGSNTDAGIDGYFLPASISGMVRADTNGDGSADALLQGVLLSLLDGSGAPVLDGNGDPVTTTTNISGVYVFGGLPPGSYQVRETQPAGYGSISDVDGTDPDWIGNVSAIVLAAGQNSTGNDFLEFLQACPDQWTSWQQKWNTILVGATGTGANPDGDRYGNLLEYAFCMPPHSGVRKPFCLVSSASVPGKIDGVYSRTAGGAQDVTYVLEHTAALGNPTVWSSVVLNGTNTVVTNNGNGTESVRIIDLETITSRTAGSGFVRIRINLDDGSTQATDTTETLGWVETALGVCCVTYNNPFLRCATFTGTVDSVDGQDLVVTTSTGPFNLADSLESGLSYYVEVTSGENEGRRYDVVSASGGRITLANDSDIHAATAPLNTNAGAPPADLAGDTIVMHRHHTLAGLFPPSGFGATGDQATADDVQVFAGSAWKIYWLYDDAGTPRWVDAADGGNTDMGATVIPPGQGMFFHNRHTAKTVLAYGEVRESDFIRPLQVGSNLVGGGYPVNQSINAAGGRAMNTVTGFFGSMDFKTADSVFVWKTDETTGATGYHTYYLLNGGLSLQRWVRVGDSSLVVRDAETLLLRDRSVFVRAKNGVPQHKSPSPWIP
jgi:hypothetical protein